MTKYFFLPAVVIVLLICSNRLFELDFFFLMLILLFSSWLTCACVNNTLRFLRWARGNCIGLTSQGESPADMVMLPMFMPVEAGDPLINLETVTEESKQRLENEVFKILILRVWVMCVCEIFYFL